MSATSFVVYGGEQKMREGEAEKSLKWIILPNESYKWDFILEEHAPESRAEERADRERIDEEADERFDKDYIVTHRRRKRTNEYYY